MALLTKSEIIQALERLGQLAQQQGYSVELLLMGGAAMVLLYNARSSTRDVDALIVSPQPAHLVRGLVKQVAQEYELAPDWLNDGAKGYLVGVSQGTVVLSTPGLIVRTPAIAQLLAMKLSAWRDDVDIEDAQCLLQTLAGSRDQIWASVEPHLVPGAELKAYYAFADLWEVIYGPD